MQPTIIDPYNLTLTLLITIAYQLIGFSLAYTLKFDKLTDFAGGTNFIILAILTLSLSQSPSSRTHLGTPTSPPQTDGLDARDILVSLFLILWAARLSGFLLFRILKTGTDTRFDDKRDKFFPFLGFWIAQMVWVFTVSLPVTVLNSPAVGRYAQPRFGTPGDVVGVLMCVLGFVVESWADVSKFRHKMEGGDKDEGNPAGVCTKGLWQWSRHPNYFGEILLHFGIFTIAVSPAASGSLPGGSGAYAALHASIVAPVFLTLLLLFVSGINLQERPGAKKRYESGKSGAWQAYGKYLEETSIFFPLPRSVYRRLPLWLKRSVLGEWPLYRFDPAKHVDKAGGEQEAGAANHGREEATA